MTIIPLVTVIGGTPHAPHTYLPGVSVELETKEAKRLVDLHLALTAKTSTPMDNNDLIASIVDAIAELPQSSFSKEGKPNIKALQTMLECEITSAQRDHAWQQFQQLSGQSTSANARPST